jgi:hypothetical protein
MRNVTGCPAFGRNSRLPGKFPKKIELALEISPDRT